MVDRIFIYCTMACLVFAMLSGCQEDAPDSTDDREYSLADVTIDRTLNPVIRYSDSAIIRVVVTGPVLLSHTGRNEERKEFTDGIEVLFFDESGGLSSRLTARYAVQYEREAKVVVRDSVVWRSADGQMLESSELIWDEREEKVYTNKFSVITTPTDTIFTQYFEADQNFSQIIMTSTDGAIIVEDINDQ